MNTFHSCLVLVDPSGPVSKHFRASHHGTKNIRTAGVLRLTDQHWSSQMNLTVHH